MIVYTAVRRLVDPAEVRGGVVLVVALAGIAVNLVATALLHASEPGEPERARRVPARRD